MEDKKISAQEDFDMHNNKDVHRVLRWKIGPVIVSYLDPIDILRSSDQIDCHAYSAYVNALYGTF